MSEHYCIGCRTPDVDPDLRICDACERRYPRLLISAALADQESREVYLARLTTGQTVKFRYAALDGDYVMLWGLDSRGAGAPELRGGPPEPILQINVRADAIVYVAELPPVAIIEHIPPGVQRVLDRVKEAAEKRFGPAKEAACVRVAT
jgi:hypothetical protein